VVLACRAALYCTLYLEYAIHIHCDVVLPTLFAHQLFDPLPAGVVEVHGVDGWFAVPGLCAAAAECIVVRPLIGARYPFASHITVSVVAVAVDGLADRQRGQPVALIHEAEKAAETGICAVGAGRLMADLGQVIDRVVGVLLGISAHTGRISVTD